MEFTLPDFEEFGARRPMKPKKRNRRPMFNGCARVDGISVDGAGKSG